MAYVDNLLKDDQWWKKANLETEWIHWLLIQVEIFRHILIKNCKNLCAHDFIKKRTLGFIQLSLDKNNWKAAYQWNDKLSPKGV